MPNDNANGETNRTSRRRLLANVDRAAMRVDGLAQDQLRAIEETRALAAALPDVADVVGSAVEGMIAARRSDAEAVATVARAIESSSVHLKALGSTFVQVRELGGELNGSLDASATTMEQMSKSLKALNIGAEDLAAASEELLATAAEMNASVTDMTTRGEANATAVEEVSTTIEQMAKGTARLANDSKLVADRMDGLVAAVMKTDESMKVISLTATEMNARVDETATTVEEVARSNRTVAEHARELEAAMRATAANVSNVAAGVEEVAATAEKNTAAIESGAAGIEQIARSAVAITKSTETIVALAETSATAAEGLVVSTRRIADLTEEARGQAERVAVVAKDSGATVARSISGFSKIRTSIADSAQVMKEMGRRAEEIGDIVATINLIADRTNLLSLNASIEAARAGEHGRGFAVVAEEIRGLSDRAGASSTEIAKIVRGLQSTARDAAAATADGVKVADESAALVGEAEKALGVMLDGIAGMGTTVREVSRFMPEQVAAAQTVGRSIADVREQSRVVLTGAGEQTTAAQSLAQGLLHMRTMAKQTSQATADQARAMREVVKANATVSASAEQVTRASDEQATASVQLSRTVGQMRTSVQKTSQAILDVGRATAEMGTLAMDVQESSKRTVVGLSEQATGAAEITRAIDAVRKQTLLTAKALAEQSKGTRQLETTARGVARSAAELNGTTDEQSKAMRELVTRSEEVRRVARATARTLEEQASAVNAATDSAQKQLDALASVGAVTAQRDTSSTKLTDGVDEVRKRAKQIAAAIAEHARVLAQLAAEARQLGEAADGLVDEEPVERRP